MDSIKYVKDHFSYFVDGLIIAVSWGVSNVTSFLSNNIYNNVSAQDVKDVVDMLNPIVGFTTTVIVLATALVRYKQTKNKKENGDD
jgi:hypothetical protein